MCCYRHHSEHSYEHHSEDIGDQSNSASEGKANEEHDDDRSGSLIEIGLNFFRDELVCKFNFSMPVLQTIKSFKPNLIYVNIDCYLQTYMMYINET